MYKVYKCINIQLYTEVKWNKSMSRCTYEFINVFMECALFIDNGVVIVEGTWVIFIWYLWALQEVFAFICQVFQTSLSKLFDCAFVWWRDIFKGPISQCFSLFQHFDGLWCWVATTNSLRDVFLAEKWWCQYTISILGWCG